MRAREGYSDFIRRCRTLFELPETIMIKNTHQIGLYETPRVQLATGSGG